MHLLPCARQHLARDTLVAEFLAFGFDIVCTTEAVQNKNEISEATLSAHQAVFLLTFKRSMCPKNLKRKWRVNAKVHKRLKKCQLSVSDGVKLFRARVQIGAYLAYAVFRSSQIAHLIQQLRAMFSTRL